MCIFTHFAAGALAGSVAGGPWAALAAGLASHALLDLFPHYDFEDWRREVALGLAPLLLLALSPWASVASLLGGLAGCLPDVENLLWKLGRLERRRMIFPTHTGLLPHGAPRGPRNLWVQAALAAICLALLPLAAPASAHAQASFADGEARALPIDVPQGTETGADPQVAFALSQARLLSGAAGITRLEVRFLPERMPADWARVDPDRVLWREPRETERDAKGDIGLLPPSRGWLVAVPTLAPPAVLDVAVEWWREPDEGGDPTALVTTAPPVIFRDVPLATVRVHPTAMAGGVPARLVVTLSHPPAGAPAAALDVARAQRDGGRAWPYGSQDVLNADLAADLARGAVLRDESKSGLDGAHPFGLTSNWVRLEVSQTGVHRLTGYDLSLLGVTATQVDPATLRLFRGGGLALPADPTLDSSWQEWWTGLTEVAVDLREDDGTWDSADAVLFYGVAGDAWRDRYEAGAECLDWVQHPGTGYGVYWLTWTTPGAPSPLPGEPRRIGPAVDAPPLGGQLVTRHLARLHGEESREDALGRLADDWAWDTRIRSQRDIVFDAGSVVPGEPARLIVDVRGYSLRSTSDAAVNQATAWLNADTAQPGAATWTVAQENDSLRVRLVASTTALLTGFNTLRVRNELGATGGLDLILDSFDLLYWAPLTKTAAAALAFAHWGDQVTDPGTAVDLRAALQDTQVVAWDVSDPDAPRALRGEITGGTSPTVTLGLVRGPDTDVHLLLFDDSDPALPPVRARRFPTDLRATLPPADYVVVYDPLMVNAASALANLRTQRVPGVTDPVAVAVSEEAVYDNFSGGRKDPWAIRNFLKWLYLRDADPENAQTGRRLKFCCLVGDASRDYRNYLQHDPATQAYDFLPTVLRTAFPHRPFDLSWSWDPYAADDALVSFDAPPLGGLDAPDVAMGRLAARGASAATAMVERIGQAELEPVAGTWRNRVALVADDLYHAGSVSETAHTLQAEVLANSYLPESIDLDKLYLVEYPFPPGTSYKPAARLKAKQLWNEGLTMFHYIGHGAENVLADEQVFLTEDVAALSNGARRGVFLAFSCDVGVFDDPTRQSMAETFVSASDGGAIAAIAASQISRIYGNNELSSAFYGALFPGRQVTATTSLGWALLAAKRLVMSRENSQRYHCFGDPAFRPPQPVSDLTFAAGSADTLHAGALERGVVDVAAAGIWPGSGATYDLRVQESRRERLIEESVNLRYWLPGASAFRGGGDVTTDPLAVPFKTPLQVHLGPHGRVRLMIDTGEGMRAAAAVVPVVASAVNTADDVIGPSIALSFPFGRYRVTPGSLAGAVVSDTSGVSVLGTSPSNSVLFELDESGLFNDVSEDFTFDSGSFMTGRVEMALPGDLAVGPHKLALFASDVLGNVSSDTLSFQLVPAGVPGFADVTIFPNPTPGECRLVFELSDPMRVSWEIYSVGGRRVWRHDEDFATPGPKVLHWDGRDGRGDAIANGVYLFVLRGSGAETEGREVREKGQIVILK